MAEESKAVRRGRRNRQRGQEHERVIANSLRALGLDTESSREYTVRSSRTWDVRFSHAGVWTRIQCKRRKPKGPIGAIAADIRNRAVEWYSLWTDGNPILAVLRWDDLLKLFAEAKGLKNDLHGSAGDVPDRSGGWVHIGRDHEGVK